MPTRGRNEPPQSVRNPFDSALQHNFACASCVSLLVPVTRQSPSGTTHRCRRELPCEVELGMFTTLNLRRVAAGLEGQTPVCRRLTIGACSAAGACAWHLPQCSCFNFYPMPTTHSVQGRLHNRTRMNMGQPFSSLLHADADTIPYTWLTPYNIQSRFCTCPQHGPKPSLPCVSQDSLGCKPYTRARQNCRVCIHTPLSSEGTTLSHRLGTPLSRQHCTIQIAGLPVPI